MYSVVFLVPFTFLLHFSMPELQAQTIWSEKKTKQKLDTEVIKGLESIPEGIPENLCLYMTV